MDLEDKIAEAGRLHGQLARQVGVFNRHGIKAHEIRKIRLVPNGRAYFNERITYSSVVTMKNGDELFFSDANIKEELDGEQLPAVF